MGIFDILELRNHVQAIGEYIFYIDTHCEPSKDAQYCHTLITAHLKQMRDVLAKMEVIH